MQYFFLLYVAVLGLIRTQQSLHVSHNYNRSLFIWFQPSKWNYVFREKYKNRPILINFIDEASLPYPNYLIVSCEYSHLCIYKCTHKTLLSHSNGADIALIYNGLLKSWIYVRLLLLESECKNALRWRQLAKLSISAFSPTCSIYGALYLAHAYKIITKYYIIWYQSCSP